MAHPLVQDMIKWMGSGNILEGQPIIHMLDYVNGLAFSKAEVEKASDPYVVFATIEWHPRKRDESIPYWTKVFEASRSETGTFAYGILVNKDKPERLHTLEAYESKGYLWDVHVKQNAAVQETIQNTKDWRISLEHNFLRIVGGFLHR
jgi:quinol monooxygenase YgiN